MRADTASNADNLELVANFESSANADVLQELLKPLSPECIRGVRTKWADVDSSLTEGTHFGP